MPSGYHGSPAWSGLALHFRLGAVEDDAGLLDFFVGKKPDHRFVVQIDDLHVIAERIDEVAAERRPQLDPVLACQLLLDFFELSFVTHHDPKVPHTCRRDFLDLEHRQELVLAELEERVAFAFIHFLEIEDVLIEGDTLFDVVDLDRDVVATVNLDCHAPMNTARLGADSVARLLTSPSRRRARRPRARHRRQDRRRVLRRFPSWPRHAKELEMEPTLGFEPRVSSLQNWCFDQLSYVGEQG